MNVRQPFCKAPEKKSHGITSGDLGGQCRTTQSLFTAHPIHPSCGVAFRYCLASETPARWCRNLLENKGCLLSFNQNIHQPILQHSKVRFTAGRSSFKKERFMYTLLRHGAEYVHLRGIQHLLQC